MHHHAADMACMINSLNRLPCCTVQTMPCTPTLLTMHHKIW
jgi:hypothetical protein